MKVRIFRSFSFNFKCDLLGWFFILFIVILSLIRQIHQTIKNIGWSTSATVLPTKIINLNYNASIQLLFFIFKVAFFRVEFVYGTLAQRLVIIIYLLCTDSNQFDFIICTMMMMMIWCWLIADLWWWLLSYYLHKVTVNWSDRLFS